MTRSKKWSEKFDFLRLSANIFLDLRIKKLTSIVYRNGLWMPRADYINDMGLWRAKSILEVLEARKQTMFHWDYHDERLIRSCVDYGIPVTQPQFPGRDDIEMQAKKLLISSSGESLVWMLASAGDSEDMKTPEGMPIFTLKVTNFAKRNPPSYRLTIENHVRELPTIKLTASYGSGTYYKEQAEKKGFDSFLYWSDKYGIAEGPFDNFFAVMNDGALITPKHNILYGVTRRIVLDLARKSGIFKDVVERPIHIWQIHENYCREVFLTSTTLGIAEVKSITSRKGGEPYTFKISPENTYTLALKEKFLNYRKKYFSERGA